jgi:hypothetical protein
LWRVIVVARAGFIITPRSSIEVGTSGPRPRCFGIVMLDSCIGQERRLQADAVEKDWPLFRISLT